MDIKNKDLKRRILEISFKHNLSHLGSCLTAVDIIKEIYDTKEFNEKFVLSSGHAGLALYVVLEAQRHGHYKVEDTATGTVVKRGPEHKLDAEKIFEHHGVHPDRCEQCHLDCSTGSLGQGLPIAVGMALLDRSKNVYCLISDGECAEGSIYEAASIIRRQKLNNLKLYLNMNYWGAYRQVGSDDLDPIAFMLNDPRLYDQLKVIPSGVNDFPFLQGQDAHYHVMTPEEYKQGLEILG